MSLLLDNRVVPSIVFLACAAFVIGLPTTARSGASDADAHCSQFELGPGTLPGERPPARESEELTVLRGRAEDGDAEAQSRLGLMYRSGAGVGPNDALAFHWFRVAAEAGDPAAQHYLGLFYLSGLGTEVDLERASYWLRRCAEINAPESLLSLAWFRLESNHLPHAAVHTAALIRNLAELGVVGAQYGLGLLRTDSSDQPAQAEGLRWLRKAAIAGHADAQFQLGVALLEGNDRRAAEPEQAVDWFLASARQGYARALRNLGVAHFVGRGVERDPSAAYGWFWLAARSGSAMAAPDAAHVASLLGEERTAEARLVALRWELAVSESPQEHRQ